MSILSIDGHLGRLPLYEMLESSIPDSLPTEVKLLIAQFIPAKTTAHITDFAANGPYGDDPLRRLAVLTDPLAADEVVTALDVSVEWQDQNWGHEKGELFLYVLPPDSTTPLRTERLLRCSREHRNASVHVSSERLAQLLPAPKRTSRPNHWQCTNERLFCFASLLFAFFCPHLPS
jgi:hypothetical protein